MLRRPQRTEAAQRLEARTARTFAAPLRAGVSLNSGPARSRRKPPAAGARARGVPRPCAAAAWRESLQRHAACGAAMHAACARYRCRAFHSNAVRRRTVCRDRGPQPPAAGRMLLHAACKSTFDLSIRD